MKTKLEMFKLIIPFIFFNLFLIVSFTKFKNKFKIIDNPDLKKIHKSISYPIGGIFYLLKFNNLHLFRLNKKDYLMSMN